MWSIVCCYVHSYRGRACNIELCPHYLAICTDTQMKSFVLNDKDEISPINWVLAVAI